MPCDMLKIVKLRECLLPETATLFTEDFSYQGDFERILKGDE
jgi:hypothetical protein